MISDLFHKIQLACLNTINHFINMFSHVNVQLRFSTFHRLVWKPSSCLQLLARRASNSIPTSICLQPIYSWPTIELLLLIGIIMAFKCD